MIAYGQPGGPWNQPRLGGPGIDPAWQRRLGRAQTSVVDQIDVHANTSEEDHDEVIDETPVDQLNVQMARTEASLLITDEPISPKKLAKWADLPDPGEARRQVARLNAFYRHVGSAFAIHEVAGGYLLLTDPALDTWLDDLTESSAQLPLTGPALETLSIIAYRQPIPRADVEAIRGVQVGEILKQLVDDQLIKVVGKDDSLGRPNLYGTTRYFLQYFGLRNLNELPRAELLRKALPDEPADDWDDDQGQDAEDRVAEPDAEAVAESSAQTDPPDGDVVEADVEGELVESDDVVIELSDDATEDFEDDSDVWDDDEDEDDEDDEEESRQSA